MNSETRKRLEEIDSIIICLAQERKEIIDKYFDKIGKR